VGSLQLCNLISFSRENNGNLSNAGMITITALASNQTLPQLKAHANAAPVPGQFDGIQQSHFPSFFSLFPIRDNRTLTEH
jgi:hypothetical protein